MIGQSALQTLAGPIKTMSVHARAGEAKCSVELGLSIRGLVCQAGFGSNGATRPRLPGSSGHVASPQTNPERERTRNCGRRGTEYQWMIRKKQE
jgi:hypothetical protein